MNVLRQKRLRRAILTALAFAWFPYISARCVPALGSADPACDVVAARGERTGRHVETGRHEHSGHDHHGPASTCCEITGKLNVTLAAPIASLDPQLLSALPVPPPEAIGPGVAQLETRAVLGRAHAPPIYLRNAVLRI